MAKRTEIKVDTSCAKCKQKVLQGVSGLQGVDKIEVDSEKGTLIVTGNVDPIDVIVRARKAAKRADVISIGPPPKPEDKKKDEEKNKEDKKKSDGKKKEDEPQPFVHIPACYHRPIVIVDDYCHTSCTIM